MSNSEQKQVIEFSREDPGQVLTLDKLDVLNNLTPSSMQDTRIHQGEPVPTTVNLRQMRVDQHGIIRSIGAQGELGRRIRDMGLVPGTEVTVIGRAPLKDPVALRLKGFTLTLRNSEADFITVEIPDNDLV
nr:FeoA family protein [Desulfoprunum benzoelyticum]